MRYQFSLSENWNWRGSYVAVGWPAFLNNGLTSATLKRLIRLKTSTAASSETRSVKLSLRATRMSVNTVVGLVYALRPEVPLKLPDFQQGNWKKTPGTKLDVTAGSPQALTPGSLVKTFGRAVRGANWKFVCTPDNTVNGRPD